MLRHVFVLIALATTGCQREPSTQSTAEAITAIHEFTCDTTAVTGDTVLRELDAETGALVLRPTGEPCRYHLLHRASDGHKHIIVAVAGYNIAW